jgi:crotonobetainyl-CoA:carnitine CoA-transferase CaiB-like acyl-CoA transferase
MFGRMQCLDKIDAGLEQWTSRLQSSEVETLLHAVGVPAERVRHIDELLEPSPDQSVFHKMNYPSGSSRLVAGVPFAFGERPLARLKPAPLLGEHNNEVLRQWIGISDEEIRELKSQGALE